MWLLNSSCRIILLTLCLCTIVGAQRTFLDSGLTLWLHRAFRRFNFNLLGSTGEQGSRLLQEARNKNRVQNRIPEDVPFPCSLDGVTSSQVPTSVHQLRPGDIDVIATIGDSLFAGAGLLATSLFHVTIENRGVAATGGGQGTWREFLTLPNIFKEFNPNLTGYALGDSLTIDPDSRLNVAEIGAMSRDMPFMARTLVKRIRNDPNIDIHKHWKFISFMIGANDFCSDICWVPSPWTALKDHKNNLIETLRILRDNLPRTFVALIPPPNLRTFAELDYPDKYSVVCDIMTRFECSCLLGLRFQNAREEYFDVMKKWQEVDVEVPRYPEFDREDFTVMVQPMTLELVFPRTKEGFSDRSYLSADCFHISQKGDARFANAVWNNLLEPAGNKTKNWDDLFKRFLCPTEKNPYLTTWRNSVGSNELS